MPKTETKPAKEDPRYEPTKAEVEEDMRIDAARAGAGRRQCRALAAASSSARTSPAEKDPA